MTTNLLIRDSMRASGSHYIPRLCILLRGKLIYKNLFFLESLYGKVAIKISIPVILTLIMSGLLKGGLFFFFNAAKLKTTELK